MSDAWQFERETAVEPTGEQNLYTASVSDEWNIGANPNGGYLASIVLRALLAEVDHAKPISVTTHYLRPGVAREMATVSTEVLRRGRTTSSATGRLVQRGKERLHMVASFGDAEVDDPELVRYNDLLTIDPVDVPPPEACVSRADLLQGVDLPILGRVEVRIPPELSQPGESGQAVTGGWIRFCDGRPPDLATLPLFCDAFPPSPFGLLGRVGWVPTLELTVHVRRPPAPGWILAQLHTQDLRDGLLVEDGVLWDSEGSVVAQCRQLSLLRVEQSPAA